MIHRNALHALATVGMATLLAACAASSMGTLDPAPRGLGDASASKHLGDRNPLALHGATPNAACHTVTTTYGATITAAVVGGGDHLALDFSTTPCDVGVYFGPSYPGRKLDHTTINGPYTFGVYVDNTNGVHVDNTAMTHGNSSGDGLVELDSTGLTIDHTTIDGSYFGIDSVSIHKPTDITIDHTAVSGYGSGNGMTFADTVSVSHSTATGNDPNAYGFVFENANAAQVDHNTASGNQYDFYFCPHGTGINTQSALRSNHNTFTTFFSC